MRHSLTAAALVSLVAAAGIAHAGPSIVGKWRAEAMTIRGKVTPIPEGMSVVLHFEEGGKFHMQMEAKGPDGKEMKKQEKGTWKVKGNTLTTTGKKVESMRFAIKGDTLTLTKPARKEKLVLKRAE